MLKLLAIIAVLLCFMPANADPLTLANEGRYRIAPYIEYLREPADPIGIESIMSEAMPWQKNTNSDINFGFDTQGYWLKFTMVNHNTLNQEWALELAYPVLDNVEVYVVNEDNQIVSYFYGGDKVKISDKVILHTNIVFPIDLFPYEPITIYARVQSEGAIQVPLTIWEWEDFSFNTLIHFLFQGLFYGMVLIMAIYNIMIWLLEKERVYVSYVCYITFFAVFQLSLHGIGYQFLWPNFPIVNDYIAPASMCMVCFAFFLFITDFFDMRRISKKIYYILKYSSNLAIILTVSAFLLPFYISIIISTLFVLYTVLLVIIVALYMLNLNHPSSRFFIIAWLVFLIGALFLLANKSGIIPITAFSEYGVQLGAGLEIMFLSLALADRMANTQKEKINAQEKSLQLAHQVNHEKERNYNAELENLRIEREHTQKLESLVTLRTKELQHTLDELSTVNDKLKTISITDALTGLNNRYYFNESWAKEHKRAHRDKNYVSIIMLDIDFFKKVNDGYGHPAGDMCLKNVASCIGRRAARDLDIVCRYGGEEFAIILPNTDEAGAIDVSEKIRQDIENLRLMWNGQQIKITASLGIRTTKPLKGNEKDRQIMINEADQALYQAKAQGRNQVVVYKAQ